MHLVGDFKVISKKKRDDGTFTYELGDNETFSTLRISLPHDLKEGESQKMDMPVKLKSGKYGLYFELARP